jgi:hypothetical protein
VFVQASRSTWEQFERLQGMPALVDSDITSSVCFLTGVTSGALCVALAGSWTFATHKHYTATVSLLAFFVGYLMVRTAASRPTSLDTFSFGDLFRASEKVSRDTVTSRYQIVSDRWI